MAAPLCENSREVCIGAPPRASRSRTQRRVRFERTLTSAVPRVGWTTRRQTRGAHSFEIHRDSIEPSLEVSMRRALFAATVSRAVVVALVAVVRAAPGYAQTQSAAAPSQQTTAAATREEITAFAKVHLAVAQA